MAPASRDADCLFCRIIDGEIPATIVDEGDRHVAIRDINPQAPSHLLVLPRDHFADIKSVSDASYLGALFQAAAALADKQGVGDGFRLVVNTGPEAGQSVFHLHIHVLGGRPMQWPPG